MITTLKKTIAGSAAVLAALATMTTTAPAAHAATTGNNANQTSKTIVPGTAYTQGFWKNHETMWPCGVNPDMPFFQSGMTIAQVLAADSSAGVYYALGQQYIAAELNLANGVVPSAQVQDALNLAGYYYANATPTTQLTADQLATVKSLIPILTAYNEAAAGTSTGTTTQCTLLQMARELKIRQ